MRAGARVRHPDKDGYRLKSFVPSTRDERSLGTLGGGAVGVPGGGAT